MRLVFSNHDCNLYSSNVTAVQNAKYNGYKGCGNDKHVDTLLIIGLTQTFIVFLSFITSKTGFCGHLFAIAGLAEKGLKDQGCAHANALKK